MSNLPGPLNTHDFSEFEIGSGSSYPQVMSVAEFFHGRPDRLGGHGIGTGFLKAPVLIRENQVHVTLAGNGEAYIASNAFDVHGRIPDDRRALVVLGRFTDDHQFRHMMTEAGFSAGGVLKPLEELVLALPTHNAAVEKRRIDGVGERARPQGQLDACWRHFLEGNPRRFAGAEPLEALSKPIEGWSKTVGVSVARRLVYLPGTGELVSRVEAVDGSSLPFGGTYTQSTRVSPSALREVTDNLRQIPVAERFDALTSAFPHRSDSRVESCCTFDVFVAADRRRGEAEHLGDRWRAELDGPSYRISWVSATQELYIVDNGGDDPDRGEAHLLGTVNRDDIDVALTGWQNWQGKAGGVVWAMQRLFSRLPELFGSRVTALTDGNSPFGNDDSTGTEKNTAPFVDLRALFGPRPAFGAPVSRIADL